MIRVLNVVGCLNLGGLETTIMSYYRHIDRSKIQFDFLFLDDPGDGIPHYYEKEAIALGARTFRVPRNSYNPIKDRKFPKAFIKILKDNPDIDIVHIHKSLPMAVAMTSVWVMFGGVKIRLAHSRGETHERLLIRMIFQPVLRILSTFWLSCSVEAGRSLFGKRAWDRNRRNNVRLFNNAREIESFRYNPETRQRVRSNLQLKNLFTIFHVGRLHPVKNQAFLIEALAYAVKKNQDIVLLIAGYGNLLDSLKHKVKTLNLENFVQFLGHRDDISDLLQASDLFVLPSLTEGLPGAAVEAQAAGLPCLLSDTISKATNIVDLVEFLPIDKGPEIWAERLLSYTQFERTDTFDAIQKSGYEIRDAVKKLENFYLELTDKQG